MPVSGQTLAVEPDSQTEWQEVETSEGIQVFSSNLSDGPIIKVKAVAVIEAGIASVREVIEDVASHADWVPYLRQSSILEKTSVREWLLYSEFDAPWPARDRDFVYRFIISEHADGHIEYTQTSVESPAMPEQKKYVRGLLIDGQYKLVPLTENRTQVEVLFYADPRGSLPLWIVNIVERGFPIDALQGLMRSVAEAE